MPESYVALADPMVQGVAPCNGRCSGKVVGLLSLLIGLGCAALWCKGNPWPWADLESPRGRQQLAAEQAIDTMALPRMQPAKVSQSMGRVKAWSPLQLGRPLQSMQPARPLQSMPPALSSFQSTQPASASASFRLQAMPVRAAQDKLLQYGIRSSPLSEFAMTAIEATNRGTGARDVSVMASTMGKNFQGKFRQLGKETALKAEKMPGITRLGFFDPLGFSTQASEGKLLFYREVELKHGRVSMLATLGILVAEQWHPLFGGNIDAPAAFAFQETPLQTFWPLVVAAIAIPEVFSVFTFNQKSGFDPSGLLGGGDQWWTMRTDRLAGDMGFDPLGLKPKDAGAFLNMQNRELNNGRLAMIAAAGMIAQELATGKKLFDFS